MVWLVCVFAVLDRCYELVMWLLLLLRIGRSNARYAMDHNAHGLDGVNNQMTSDMYLFGLYFLHENQVDHRVHRKRVAISHGVSYQKQIVVLGKR